MRCRVLLAAMAAALASLAAAGFPTAALAGGDADPLPLEVKITAINVSGLGAEDTVEIQATV
ncbi:MAG: hypothetical protein LBQ92_04030, partial [Propionibacteriaceae bacterium]|nr:hypothetical protein [Propionibacteriaceae bacterium]